MTTSRIVRGTKGRVFLYVCAILIVTGIIACYNNTRIELDNVQKSGELCRQEQENLSTQLQVISDYKLRLEKSLKTEKAEHQKNRVELESDIKELKSKNEKYVNEVTMRFNSLQQQHSLLKTQHNDLTDECSKIQKDQLDEINDLQAKTKEIQGQLKQSERDKENSLEHLKSQLEQLKIEKENLEKQIKGNSDKEEILKLRKELSDLKANCPTRVNGYETLQAPVQSNGSMKAPIAKQISLNEEEYRISGNKNEANGVGDIPSNVDDDNNFNANQVDSPKQEKAIHANANEQYVLPLPNNIKSDIKSSTPNSNLKNASSPNLNIAAPLKVPTVTPETLKIKTPESKQLNNPVPAPAPNRKFPDNVVPIQNQHFSFAEQKPEDDVASLVNNRYRNIVDDDKDKRGKVKERVVEIPEKDNGANEIFDVPISAGEGNKQEQTFQKHHIDSLGLGEKDKVYDGGDYEKDQNDGNFGEDEDDDFGNHIQEPAIRH